jgi:peptidoglycan-N-acetylglucosamine deacetylase
MKPIKVTRLIYAVIILPFLVSAQEIALTFDDAPTADSPLLTGTARTERIITTLKEQRIQAAFFVLTGQIDETGKDRLDLYSKHGHILANHSHSHRPIHQVGTAAYIADVKKADSILSTYPAYIKWFRYPFLDEGKTVTARDSIRTALRGFGLKNGYVTVDNYDWYLNHLLAKARMEHKRINLPILRHVYVEHIYNSIHFYDEVARKYLGRSPKHVLLLHENDLTALFLGDLIKHLKKNGWKIISPRDAYEDAIATYVPDVLFNGQGRVAAIAREKGTPARELVQDAEDEEFLDNLVRAKKIFE